MLETISINIAKMREKKRWSQQYLATLMEVAQPTIGKWENKKPPDNKVLEKLANLFGISITWFFEEHPEEDNQEVQPAPEIKKKNYSSYDVPDKVDPSVIEFIERRIGLLEAKFEEEKSEISQQLKKQNQVLEQFLNTQNKIMENFAITVSGELREIKKNLGEAEQWSKINIHLEGNEASQENSERMI